MEVTQFPVSVVSLVDFRPAAVLAKQTPALLVGQQVLRGDPGNFPGNFNLDIGSKEGQIIQVVKVVLGSILKGLEVREPWGRYRVEDYGIVRVDCPEGIQISSLPGFHMLAM